MRATRALGVAVAAVLLAAPSLSTTVPSFVSPAAAQRARVDISIFFDQLAPYGRWVNNRSGYVFIPAGISADWRPYSVGHWVYARRYGWTWVSDEPWAWAAYHYGRWGYDDDNGWYWVPGNVWAPAWVAWETTDDYIGWAPLPAYGNSYIFNYDVSDVDIGVGAWRFVESRYFLDRDLRRRYLPFDRNEELIRLGGRRGHVTREGNIVVNNMVDVDRIERVTNTRVTARNIVDSDRPRSAEVQGNTLRFFHRDLAARRPDRGPRDAERVDRLDNRMQALTGDAPAHGRRGDRFDRDRGPGSRTGATDDQRNRPGDRIGDRAGERSGDRDRDRAGTGATSGTSGRDDRTDGRRPGDDRDRNRAGSGTGPGTAGDRGPRVGDQDRDRQTGRSNVDRGDRGRDGNRGRTAGPNGRPDGDRRERASDGAARGAGPGAAGRGEAGPRRHQDDRATGPRGNGPGAGRGDDGPRARAGGGPASGESGRSGPAAGRGDVGRGPSHRDGGPRGAAVGRGGGGGPDFEGPRGGRGGGRGDGPGFAGGGPGGGGRGGPAASGGGSGGGGRGGGAPPASGPSGGGGGGGGPGGGGSGGGHGGGGGPGGGGPGGGGPGSGGPGGGGGPGRHP